MGESENSDGDGAELRRGELKSKEWKGATLEGRLADADGAITLIACVEVGEKKLTSLFSEALM